MAHYPLIPKSIPAQRPYYTTQERHQNYPPTPSTTDWQWQNRSSSYLTEPTHTSSSTFQTSWNVPTSSETVWSFPRVEQTPYRTSNEQLMGAPVQSLSAEYPESSQRTILPPSPQILPSGLYTTTQYQSDRSRSSSSPSPDLDDRSWTGEYRYSTDERETSIYSPAPVPPVKVEQDETEDCFIMELPMTPACGKTLTTQHLAPPTEVPLRATQATGDMRKMMGVFRLNPFAMHSGSGRGLAESANYSGEARPLDEEPSFIEFQLDLDGVGEVEPKLDQELRAFSPSLSIEDDGDGEGSEWADQGLKSQSILAANWDLQYPAPETYRSSSSEYAATDYSPALSARSGLPHLSPNGQSYLRKNLYCDSTDYSTLANPASFDNDRTHLQLRPPSQPGWPSSRNNYPVRRSLLINPNADCDLMPGGLPSIAASNRRWSMPNDSALNVPFVM